MSEANVTDLFYIAINRLLGNEGGYVNDPADPGGETNWGISKRSYPTVEIKTLTREAAIEIYRKDFWDTIQAGKLAFGISYQALDFAVNSGIGTVIRAMQRAIGVADDGNWGPHSQEIVKNFTEADLIMLLSSERLFFMTGLKNWPTFGKGWARRVALNLRYGAIDA